MRSVVCHELGPVEKLTVEECPTPVPGAGKVRIAVAAAGASYVTALQVAGRYQFPLQPPYVPGAEVSGVIDAVGTGAGGWRPGDRVFASVGSGAFAEHVIAEPDQLVRLPDEIDFARGASFLQAYGTAWFAMTRRMVVRTGQWVLVTGAGGGVGLAAVDVARAVGARVIAVASSEEKRDLARGAGAEAVIDPQIEDVKTRARELTDGEGLDVVYDVVGGGVSESALRALRDNGHFVVIGFAGGIARIPLNLVLLKNRTVVGVEWGSWVRRNPEENRALVAEVVAAVARGDLRPVVPAERPIEEAGAVLSELLDRRAVGRTVLVP
jgi:NADPH2:quinone reductase